jgi:hypothetical protein
MPEDCINIKLPTVGSLANLFSISEHIFDRKKEEYLTVLATILRGDSGDSNALRSHLKHLYEILLRICGFSSGWWKVGSWYLLYVKVQPHCNVLVTVYTSCNTTQQNTTQHGSQYNTLQPPRLVPVLLGYPWQSYY